MVLASAHSVVVVEGRCSLTVDALRYLTPLQVEYAPSKKLLQSLLCVVDAQLQREGSEVLRLQ